MKTVSNTETALAVQFITEPQFKSAVFTLAQAAKFSAFVNESLMEDGGPCGSGSFIYHPEKGLVAWVSSNRRVWKVKSEDQIGRGGLTEFSKADLSKHFSKVNFLNQ